MEKAGVDITKFKKEKKKHTEKGRAPINGREEILDMVAKLTNTKIPRWVRYDEQMLRRAYANFQEINHDGHVKNKAAYFTHLLKLYKA